MLIAPTLIPKKEPAHLYRSQAVNQGVDDQEFAQFVDNPDTLEVDVIRNFRMYVNLLKFWHVCNL